jgi:hypothetical protein
MKLQLSKYLVKMANHYLYGGGQPASVSTPRWRAMVKQIKRLIKDGYING